MDEPTFKDNLKAFKKKLPKVEIYEVSALNDTGLEQVMTRLADLLDEIKATPLIDDEVYEDHILYKYQKEEPFTIEKEGDCYVLKGEIIEKLFRMTKFNTDEAVLRFARKLMRLGVDDKLDSMGAKQGDIVKILDYEFEYRK